MNPDRFDAITRLFSESRFSRRKALTETGAGIAATAIATAGFTTASAQDATPAVPVGAEGESPTMLFVQSFQSGHITPKTGEDGRYVVTLEHGLGETVYFSDRPDRIVGAWPTQNFLDWIGFQDDNPPNAAMLTSTGEGENTLAVFSLFDPSYDADSAMLTYDVEVLEHWKETADVAFGTTPVDIDALGVDFGTTHVFIDGADDCPDVTMSCKLNSTDEVVGTIASEEHDGYCYFAGNFACFPCDPWVNGDENHAYWMGQCEARFDACADGACYLWNYCSRDAPLGHTYCQNSDVGR